MLLLLTNASATHKGNKVVLNTDLIVSIFNTENVAKKEDGVIENVTYVFCPPHGTWEVEESMEFIIEQTNIYNAKS
jgi:hypothetical protein